jgi:hypothetical protein
MRGGLLRSWPGLTVVVVLGACSNIIGISNYEIDPSLGEGGTSAQGGKASAGEPSAAGDETGGSTVGGSQAHPGGNGGDAGDPNGGTAGAAGDPNAGGQGGAAPTGCTQAGDCDDTIDCTVDACGADGVCTHTADDTLCTPLAGSCATCTAGIGCVETPGAVKELLLDPGFDLKTGDWVEYKDGLPASIVADATAQTPGIAVHLGPAPAAATQQGFIDLSQQITIPKSTVLLTVSGYYKLTPGKLADPIRDANDDYATLTLFSLADENGDFVRFTDYHRWNGSDPKQAVWTAFTYTTSKTVLAKVLDQDVTLDLVTETWDTRFLFDSLSLKATTCE